MRSQLLFITLLFSYCAFAQSDLYKIEKVDNGLYHLYYDSSTAKTTIVEFDKFLVLLEVPIRNDGGGATNLKDNVYAGNRVIKSVTNYFPSKPIKYLLHSHWHPHSISSVTPFLQHSVTIVTTAPNFKRVRQFSDSTIIDRYKKYVHVIRSDSFLIKDRSNSIVAYRFLQKDYPNTPTTEYLYFYLPRYDALHTGCMYNRWRGEPIDGKELLTAREQDIQKFLHDRHLRPASFLRNNGDTDELKGMIPYEKFENVIQHGISNTLINEKYLTWTDNELKEKKDSIIAILREHHIPVSFVNTAAYNELRRKRLDRALEFAKIQLALAPDEPNSWDTLGEIHYFLSDTELARVYEKHCKRSYPEFTQGGEQVWKETLARYQRLWQ